MSSFITYQSSCTPSSSGIMLTEDADDDDDSSGNLILENKFTNIQEPIKIHADCMLSAPVLITYLIALQCSIGAVNKDCTYPHGVKLAQ